MKLGANFFGWRVGQYGFKDKEAAKWGGGLHTVPGNAMGGDDYSDGQSAHGVARGAVFGARDASVLWSGARAGVGTSSCQLSGEKFCLDRADGAAEFRAFGDAGV